ncbi:putative metal chaperone YciC [compost metagenome]
METAGTWWASMPLQERLNYIDYVDNRSDIEQKWDRYFGDRLNELVFIGQDLDKGQLNKELSCCLLNDEELIRYAQHEEFKNPFEHML